MASGDRPSRCRCAPRLGQHPLLLPGLSRLRKLGGAFREMASGQHTEVQDGLVALDIAGRAATPFVITDPFYLLEQCLVSGIIARQTILARLSVRMPLTQPELPGAISQFSNDGRLRNGFSRRAWSMASGAWASPSTMCDISSRTVQAEAVCMLRHASSGSDSTRVWKARRVSSS